MLVFEGRLVKRLKAKRIRSLNGEVHYVVEESGPFERVGHTKFFDEREIKRITKQDASKPLFLIRGAE
jgi:hypothetical protein